MPRKVSLASTDINPFTAIGCDFALAVQDGDLIIPDTNVRRMIMPDQDIDEQCDDLDSYFTSKGYPTITAADRQTIKDVRAAAEANPDMAARKQAWLDQQAAQAAAMAPPAEEPTGT